jgi:uncharacterized protein DUF2330
MRTHVKAILIGAIVTASFVPNIGERVAHACGGCFSPPENPTVVTDHRMVLTVARDQTTLYDQIRYQGDPKAFAWVLPIAGVAKVGLSSNVLFQSLDQFTQTQIIPPSRGGANGGAGGSSGASSSGSSGSSDGVTVLKAEQVGPYETVQLRSTDPNALTTWLAKNGFQISDDIKPVIQTYVGQSLDFLALKLVPGAGIREMRPIRVTTAGASPVLPLRMVAAGAGATLGMTLWIVAEGRYEPQNFPWFRIDDSMLVWDQARNESNYKTLRTAFNNAFNGKAWELESSIDVAKLTVVQQVRALTGPGVDSAEGYSAVEGGVYGTSKTAEQAREEDLDTLFAGIASAQARVTRIRADLSKAALASDLSLQASADQDTLSNIRLVTRFGDGSSCPNCPSAQPAPELPAPRTNPPAASGGSSEGAFSCSNATQTPVMRDVVGWSLAIIGGALALRARRRRR